MISHPAETSTPLSRLRGVAVATSGPSTGAHESARFTTTGRIKRWDLETRLLWIDERPLWVAPGVLVPDPGTTVTALGHHEGPSRVWVVTYITWAPGIVYH